MVPPTVRGEGWSWLHPHVRKVRVPRIDLAPEEYKAFRPRRDPRTARPRERIEDYPARGRYQAHEPAHERDRLDRWVRVRAGTVPVDARLAFAAAGLGRVEEPGRFPKHRRR